MKSNIEINKAVDALTQREITQLEDAYKGLDYLEKLNNGQKIAATRDEGNYLVIAGPGTGKTHTLVYRVLHLIKKGVDPKAIVIITFTRKAGNVLSERLNYLIPNTRLGFVGTFHAFANHISQLIGSASPISKFRLLDSEDDIEVHKLVLADFGNFKRNQRAKGLQKMISYCCNTGLSVKEYIKKFDLHKMEDDADNIENYMHMYEKYKVDHMLANYDDLISVMSRYLEKEDGTKVTAPYSHLMIDEYQDTNEMQLDFVKRLKIPNVMAIGDDFQGIYAFRGADHRIILNFFNDFKDPQMIKLTENYRSNDAIVGWTNQTIARSKLGYHKALKAASGKDGNVKVISGASLDNHKAFVIDSIKNNTDKTHALIYRFNKNRTVFEKALIAENIDYVVYGGVRLLERKHVKDVLSFLMVYLNRRDVVGFNRILTLLPGIGVKTAKRLIKTNMEDISHLKGEKHDLVKAVKELLCSTDEKSVLFDKICAFYFSIYESIESDYYTKEEIEDDFKLVRDLLVTFDALENFIVNIILEPVVDLKKGKNPKVVLTTIHSAKGLEFDCVYYFHTHDWYKNYDLETLEEDRRLFYVGISRAKHQLYVFDHTEVSRDFKDILRDFDSLPEVESPETANMEAGSDKELSKDLSPEKDSEVKSQIPEAMSDIAPHADGKSEKHPGKDTNQTNRKRVVDNVIHVDFGRRS